MTAILLLFLLGTLLLVFEVFMPSSVLGILGAVAMLDNERDGEKREASGHGHAILRAYMEAQESA